MTPGWCFGVNKRNSSSASEGTGGTSERNHMNPTFSCRQFFRISTTIAILATLAGCHSTSSRTEARWIDDSGKPLMAYVGTFTSPLKDMLSTQVDLPPGNGRGIHLFRVDRK